MERKKYLTRILALTLIIALLPWHVSIISKANTISEDTYSNEADLYTSEMVNSNYTNVSKMYTAPYYTGESVEVNIEKAMEQLPTAKITNDNYDYKNAVINMEIGDEVTFLINAPETARYFLEFDYLTYDSSILPIELSMKINGEYPFYEARRLVFESTWVSKEEKSFDRYDNEIVSIPEKLIRWESKYLMDASYRHSTPLTIQLEEGENEINLSVTEGSLLLGNMYLHKAVDEIKKNDSEPAKGNEVIVIEGEDFTYRNNSSIRATAEYEVDLTPYEIENTLLNTIDSESFKKAGQKVTYDFKVDKAGYYYIALNYRQSDKNDFPVFVDVLIDGDLYNEDFKAYPLEYTTKYKRTTLQEDNEYLSVFLDEGIHSISFVINIENIRVVLEAVDRIMGGVNDLALEITKVAGTNKDKYRDLKMTRYIPDIEERLLGWADELDELHESMKVYNKDNKKIATFAPTNIASAQLRSLAKKPNELPYRVAELSASINSVNQHLANLVDGLNNNNLAIDSIFLYQEDGKLPAKVNFLKAFIMNVKRFFLSFVNQAYSVSNVDENNLQVWVNRPRQYLEIMQKMIDDEFTPKTGIKVDLSLMPDQNKLVLANSSGDAPDIATGINYAIPFELGIRGAIKDLTEFDDFVEIASKYPKGLHVPATIDEGIYAMPETMNFWVMFYRKDVLDKLGLSVPSTMEDVMNILPELQMRGLNFYYPTAGMIAMRNFHGTTPLLFQNEATLYGEYAGDTTLNSEEAVEGFTLLTELFTIYNMPVDIPNFYQHFRSGNLPIGIGDYGVYNLLLNAAPEIANSWEIALIPGVENDQGEVLRYASGGAESTVMFCSNEDRENDSWEFMKWWSNAETQSRFGQTLQISYGEEYIWHTANLEAFTSLPWKTSDKDVILEQANWILEAPRILGTYMLEREMSNAFNDIVVNGKTLRTRLDRAVKIIDRETERKLEEFGYMESGEVIKEYKVPTIETVNKILSKE